MSSNDLLALVIILRIIACMIGLVSASIVALQGKEGWGWILFVSLWLGAISLDTDKEDIDQTICKHCSEIKNSDEIE